MNFEKFMFALIMSLIITVLLFIAFTIVLKMIVSDESDYVKVEVKCYDENNNEIKDSVCLEKVYCGSNPILNLVLENCEDMGRINNGN